MMPVEWHVRRASVADLDSVLAIEQLCEEAPHWTRDSWLEALSEGLGLARASFVAESHSEIIGFAVVSCTGELAELETIAVSRHARRKGVGQALCRQGMNWSRSRGATVIELEVRASSGGALALYRVLGFVEQGKRRGYFGNPTEDAVLMAAALEN